MASTAQRHKIAKRYALALFELTKEKKQIDPVYKNLATISQWLDESPELNALFENPEFSSQKLKTILDILFRSTLDPLAAQFLFMLARHDRLTILKEICTEFEKIYFEYKEILQVKIISARELKKDQLEAITKRLQSRFKKDIDYNVELDPKLIGGFKIQVGDLIHDFSVQNQLDNFKKRVLSS